MITEMRRSRRHQEFMPIAINAVDGISGKKLAGPFSAKIVDLSQHGCRIILSQVLLNSYHIFYSTRENDSTVLQLMISFPNQNQQITIPSRPIWLDRCCLDTLRFYTIGVELLTSPEGELVRNLQHYLEEGQKKRVGWWEDMGEQLKVGVQ